MKIESKQGPSSDGLPNTQPTSSQQSARSRAIAMLSQQPAQSQEHAVRNPSNVQPEEMTAVLAPSSSQSESEQAQVSTSDSPRTEERPKEVTQSKEDPLSTQYALLARKEKALRAKVQQQEAATKAREQALIAREEAIKAKESEYQSNYIQKSRLKSDPLTVLAEEGVSYDELTKAILSPQVQQDPRLLAELEKIKEDIRQAKEEQQLTKRSYEAQQKQAYDQAVSQIRNETKQLVNSDPNFETIKETNSVNDVVELIEKTFNKDGVLLSVEEAAREVEEYLVEEAIKLAKIKKIQNRLTPVSKPVQKQSESQPNKQPQSTKTLTNTMGTSPKLSARERAILAMQGKLKQ